MFHERLVGACTGCTIQLISDRRSFTVRSSALTPGARTVQMTRKHWLLPATFKTETSQLCELQSWWTPLVQTNTCTCTCIIFAQAEKRTDQEVAVRTAFYWEQEVLVHAISDGVLPVWLAIVVSAKNQRLDRWRQTEDCHSTVALGACLSHFGLPNTCQLENGQIPHVSVSRTSWRCFWTP